MRKLPVLIVMSALMLGGVSPADAASSYKIRLDPKPKIKTNPKHNYNDTSLDLSEGTERARRQTTIRGRVTGGKVKGQRVRIYATNTNLANAKRKSLGSAKLSSKGVFRKRFDPGHDHAGRYRIEIVKSGKGRRAGTTKTFYINAYQFVEMRHFYDAGSPSAQAGLVGPSDREEFANGIYYRQGFFATGGTELVFNTSGYNCIQMNFKTGIATRGSRVGGTFSAVQRSASGDRVLVGQTSMARGQGLFEPSRSQQKRMRSTGSFVFRVNASSEVADQRDLRFVLGRPMAACTYPVKGGTPVPTP